MTTWCQSLSREPNQGPTFLRAPTRPTNVKVQPPPAEGAFIHPYLKEEITPGGIHPDWGHDPEQTRSEEGREEGDGAEEESLRRLLGKHDLRPVSAREPSEIPLETTLFWN